MAVIRAPDPYLIPSPASAAAQEWARSLAGTAIALNIIAFAVFSLRIYTRSYPVFQLKLDDYVISVAYVGFRFHSRSVIANELL